MTPRAQRPELPASDAALVGLLFAVDPHGLGGVMLSGMPGPVRRAWLDRVRALLPESAPWLKVPVNVSDDRLLGGLDFAATVGTGKPVFATGLIEAADGGVLVLSMAERLQESASAVIGSALDLGEVRIERDGLARVTETRFGIVALDESIEDDERVPEGLSDRLAFQLRLDQVELSQMSFGSWTADAILDARRRYLRARIKPGTIAALCGSAAAFGIPSLRAEVLCVRVAKAVTALRGGRVVSDEDAATSARLVLPQRARRLPVPEPETADQESQQQPEQSESERDGEQASKSGVPDEVLVDAVAAAIPPGLLAELQRQAPRRRRQSTGGRGESKTRGRRRGRPVGVRPTDTIAGQRLNVLATLKAAAPWQQVRSSATGRSDALHLRKEDLHVTRFEDRVETTIVFAVDASGSQAAQRLAEVKGAVEILLNDCYVRRDQVALIAFRGSEAEVILPPTRSLARARRTLAALPGGGGTPLAAGIDSARELAEAIARQGRVPAVVLLTDGRANIARDAEPGAERAEEDALAAARLMAVSGVNTMLVDTSRRPRPRASSLAQAMGARYVPLPKADAESISATVQRGIT
ncbi:MAG: magnesium chelatase subunit D [Woeseiaceae bacterium]|nr:magnesium chelatase subunit D [Woeseiaceae bacterium]